MTGDADFLAMVPLFSGLKREDLISLAERVPIIPMMLVKRS